MQRREGAQLAVAWGGAGVILTGLYVLYASFRSQLWDYPYNVPPGELSLGQLLLIPILVLTGITLLGFSIFTWRLTKGKRVPKGATILTQSWALFLVAGGIALVGVSAHYQFDTWIYDSSPYLTWTGGQNPSTSITACWYAGLPDVSTVRYGTDPAAMTNVAGTGLPGQFHAVAIEGLTPNTTYYYQAGRNPVKQFTTAPAGAHAFTFAVWSDPRQNDPFETAVQSVNLPGIMAGLVDADFSICTGDITSRGVDYETWKLWFEDITTADWASNRSHQIAIGNHERSDDCVARNFVQRYPYAQDAGGHFYYSFDYGHVHFVMLDPWNYSSCWWGGFTAAQLAWLEADLAAAQASSTFTVVGIHPDPRSGGMLGDQFTDILSRYRVDLLFCGHIHNYWRTTINQTVVIREGIGGNVYSREMDTIGFCTVSVNATAMVVTAMRASGAVFDTVTLVA